MIIQQSKNNFVSSDNLSKICCELMSSPGWVFRSALWRFHLLDQIEKYDHYNRQTWICYQDNLLEQLPLTWKPLFDSVLDLAGPKFRLMRYVINGQTQHQLPSIHYDVPLDLHGTYRTYLIYLNTEWNKNWGGETEFVRDGNIVHQEWPEPGKLIEYDSKILHVGKPPVSPNTLRLSIALQGNID